MTAAHVLVAPRVKAVEYACHDARFRRCAIAFAVAFVESGYQHRPLAGCQPYRGPHGEDHAQARCAVVSLAHGIARCGTIRGALARYSSQSGECRPPTRRQRMEAADYVRDVMRVVRALERH